MNWNYKKSLSQTIKKLNKYYMIIDKKYRNKQKKINKKLY